MASYINSQNATYLDKFYELANDIDYSGTYTPIGFSVTSGGGPNATTTFYSIGQFDGAGHYISGIDIDNNSANNQGLFGVIGSGAIVKNLVLTNSDIDGNENVGGIAGTNFGTIENCHVTKTVTIHATHTQGPHNELKCQAHGGIVGLNEGTVTGCSSSAVISSANSTNKNQGFGGIVGHNGKDGKHPGIVSYNFAIGVNLSSCGEGNYGAIIGQNQTGTVTTNYYNGCKLDGSSKESSFGVGHKQGNNTTPIDVDGSAEHGYYAALIGEYIIATTQSTITTVIVPAHLEDNAIEKTTYHIYESSEISFALTHNRAGYITDFVTSTEGTLSGTTLNLNDQNATVTAPWDVTVGEVTSELYDGNTHYTPSIDITDASPSKSLALDTDYTISFGDKTPQDADVYAITITGTGNYYGSVTTKDFEIEKRSVTLTSATDEKVYDGIALTNGNVTVSGDGFATSEGATYNVTGTILDYGQMDNTFTYTLNDGTKAANYNIIKVEGKLTINKVSTEIVISASSDSKTYDGSALTNDGYTYTENVLVTGDVLTAVVEGSITNAGSTSNNVTSYKVTRSSDQADVTGNYTFGESVAGTLTVNPKAVTITAKDASRTYNGSALTQGEFESSALEEGDTHAFTVVMTEGSTITNVGTQLNVIATVDGTAVTTGTETAVGNYLVTTANGTLEVTRKDVSITAKGASRTYNGSALTEGGFTASELEAGDTHTFTVAMTNQSTITDAGTTPNVIATVDGVSVTTGTETAVGNYMVTTANGELEVTQKAVTVTAHDKSFTYTGSAQSWSYYEVDGLVGDDAITAVVTGSITFPSESPVTNELTSYEFITGTAGNYSVTTANGSLTMTNASVAITITAASDEWAYDGNPHSNTEVTVTFGTLLTGDALVATATGSVTDVSDTQDNNNPIASGYKVMHGEEDVTANYAITAVAGKLTINPKVTEYDFITVTETGNSTTVDINGDIPSSLTENELSEIITATEVTYTRTFDTPYATICLPFAVSASEVAAAGKFYQFTQITGDYEVVMTEVTGGLVANTPYIIEPKSTTDEVSFSYGNLTINPAGEPTTAPDAADWAFKGTYMIKSFKDVDPEEKAIYFFASTDQKDDAENVEINAGDFVITDTQDDATKAAPFRAYLEYTGNGNLSLPSSSATGRDASASIMPRTLKVIIVNGDGTITKIGSISVSGEDKWFTIDGIQIEGQPTEGGMYIRNGRAVMVK